MSKKFSIFRTRKIFNNFDNSQWSGFRLSTRSTLSYFIWNKNFVVFILCLLLCRKKRNYEPFTSKIRQSKSYGVSKKQFVAEFWPKFWKRWNRAIFDQYLETMPIGIMNPYWEILETQSKKRNYHPSHFSEAMPRKNIEIVGITYAA